ncbi:hypothetical protein HZC08_01155 [Candidatus Micrarchaeota archaeon]|nr:hypothetical protein [Candidatus Micrarchaeota archaeon]
MGEPPKKENLYYITSAAIDKEVYGLATYIAIQIPKDVARELNSLQIRIESTSSSLSRQYPKGPKNPKEKEFYQSRASKIFDMKERYQLLLNSGKGFSFPGPVGLGNPGQILKEDQLPEKFRQLILPEKQKQRL